MATVRINSDLVEIDGIARVERGPKTCVAIATEALLDDAVTAGHYFANLTEKELAEFPEGSPHPPKSFDALGKPIYIGEEMTYRDWLGEPWYHVYQWEEPIEKDKEGIWTKVGEFATEAEAVSEATKIAIQLAAKEQA